MSRYLTGGAVAALVVAACAFAASASAQTYNRLVVFGDSLSDNGNLYLIVRRHAAAQSPPYFQGRFSTGPVFVGTAGLQRRQLQRIGQRAASTTPSAARVPTPRPARRSAC